MQPYPVVFLVIAFAVWSAARFPTFPAALHCLVLGGIALWLSLTGHGPFDAIEDPVAEVLVSQLFMVAVLLTGLAVGALGDRVDESYAAETAARAEAAEQAELLAEMTESMDEGLVVLDADGRVERSNGASRRLAHRVSVATTDAEALAELVGLLRDPDPSATGAMRAELGVGDVVISLSSGEEVVLAVSRATLSRANGRPGVLLVLREVTEHRSGLRPLAGFASTAAHDLRGPLSAIRSWVGLAADDLEPDSPAAEPLRRAERASEQMGDLIGDLLEHALAESGELAAREVPLTGPDGVLDQVSGLLGPDDVLTADPDLPSVRADPVALRQLFGNLVGNAVKYARPGEPATIAVRARRKGSRVVVEIEDCGVGVEDSERSLIFQRFHRSGAVRAHFRGTGMGLSICQTIVQRHGGTIECLTTPPGSGTVFRFDLPAAEPALGGPIPGSPTRVAACGGRFGPPAPVAPSHREVLGAAVCGVLLLGALVSGCTDEADGSGGPAGRADDGRWRTSTAPVRRVRPVLGAVGSTVHLADGTTVDTGRPPRAYVVAGDGCSSCRPTTTTSAGDSAFTDA